MPVASATRVPQNTDPDVNERIWREARVRINYFKSHPKEIDRRLKELDEEWDIERMLETGSAAISLAGLVLGITKSQRFLLFPVLVQAFMLQHAIQGWAPPLPVLRRLGFRTPNEIEQERAALLAIRGNDEKDEAQKAKGNAAARG